MNQPSTPENNCEHTAPEETQEVSDADQLMTAIANATVSFAIAKKELTPDCYDPQDPNNLVRLRQQSHFLIPIASNDPDSRVSDALAGRRLAVFKTYGPSRELDEALYACLEPFGINFTFVVAASRRTLRRWTRQPSMLQKKSWALTSVVDDGGDPWDLGIEGPLMKTPRKRERDGRSKYIAFEWLAKCHVFGRSAHQIDDAAKIDYRDVTRQIKWAAAQLGITPKKPRSGRPAGAKTKIRNHIS